MPWIPIVGALKRVREDRKMEQTELAKRAGVSVRAVRYIESKTPPRSLQPATVKSLAKLLGCEPETLARWTTQSIKNAPGPEIDDPTVLPPLGTLGRRADQERRLGTRQATVAGPGGTYDLLGPALLKHCMAAFFAFLLVA